MNHRHNQNINKYSAMIGKKKKKNRKRKKQFSRGVLKVYMPGLLVYPYKGNRGGCLSQNDSFTFLLCFFSSKNIPSTPQKVIPHQHDDLGTDFTRVKNNGALMPSIVTSRVKLIV